MPVPLCALPHTVHIASDRIYHPKFDVYTKLYLQQQASNPSWKFKVYNRSERTCWVLSHGSEQEQRSYFSLSHEVLRVDLFRLLLLWREGGVYADDKLRYNQPLDEMPLLCNGDTFMCEPYGAAGISNWFIAVKRASPVIRAILDRVLGNIRSNRTKCAGCPFDRQVWHLTGPRVLHDVVERYLSITFDKHVHCPTVGKHSKQGTETSKIVPPTAVTFKSNRTTAWSLKNATSQLRTHAQVQRAAMEDGHALVVWTFSQGWPSVPIQLYGVEASATYKKEPGSYHRLSGSRSMFVSQAVAESEHNAARGQCVPAAAHAAAQSRS